MNGTRVWLFILVFLFLIGCGDSHDPVTSGIGGDTAPAAISQSSYSGIGNRVVWGLWKIRVSADRNTVDVVPDRVGAMHFNVVRLLEVKPCSDCLTISNVQLLPDNELSADLTLRHPFPGLLNFTGFDVRGIFISGAEYTFPVSGKNIAWGDDIPRMLNPDGYTVLFNPTDFPETDPPILGYIPGHKAPGGDLSATLNPYVAYERDQPRCLFMPGTESTRNVLLHIPDGPLEFGYAVDASWFPADGDVTDPVEDFPPKANSIEAFKISVEVGTEMEHGYGSAPIQVEVYDHQGLDTIDSVLIEAPDLFSGEIEIEYSETTADGSFLFSGEISNELDVKGIFPVLARVTGTEADENLGTVDAWQVHDVLVKTGWARTWGGTGGECSNGVAADGSGSICVTGSFMRTVDLDPGPGINEHSTQNPDDNNQAFLSKFDSSGVYQWGRSWGGDSEEFAYGIAVDAAGNIYVTGEFWETADFNPDSGDPHTSNGIYDAFLSKFDSSGNFEWARTWGGPYEDRGYSVAVDGLGNVYVAGDFKETADFDPGGGTDEHSSNGMWDIFLSKFDSSGNFQWALTWGAWGADRVPGVDVDESDNIYVTGTFGYIVDFDPGDGENYQGTSDEVNSTFLSKFDSSGNLQWACTWATSGHPFGGREVRVDSAGDVFVTGGFAGDVDFDPGIDIDIHSSSGLGNVDAFLSKFDSSGNYQWAQTWGGSDGQDSGNGVAVDGSGSAYVAGDFWGTVDFDPGDGIVEHISLGEWDGFLSKFDSTGNFQWVRTLRGPLFENARGVACDDSGNAYTVGSFNYIVDFDPGPEIEEHTSNGIGDAFMWKVPPDGYW